MNCGLCGKPNLVLVTCSTCIFGSELDGRVVGPGSSDHEIALADCAHCGYVDFDLESPPVPGAAEIVASPAYRALWNTRPIRRPRGFDFTLDHPKAREYVRYRSARFCSNRASAALRRAMLCEARGDLGEAAYAMLSAAWTADSEADTDGARDARRLAANLFERALAGAGPDGPTPADDRLTQTVVLIDIRRRSGDFEIAAALCRELERSALPDDIRRIVAFEAWRCEARDDRAFEMKHVFPPSIDGDEDWVAYG